MCFRSPTSYLPSFLPSFPFLLFASRLYPGPCMPPLYPPSLLNIARGHSRFFLPQALFYILIPPCVSTINCMVSQFSPSFVFSSSQLSIKPALYRLSSSLYPVLFTPWFSSTPPSFLCSFYHCHTYGFMFILMTFLPPYFAHSLVTSCTAAFWGAVSFKKDERVLI